MVTSELFDAGMKVARDLHRLKRSGLFDSIEASELRNQMVCCVNSMTEQERGEFMTEVILLDEYGEAWW